MLFRIVSLITHAARILLGGHGVIMFRKKSSAASFCTEIIIYKISISLLCTVQKSNIITFDFVMLFRARGNSVPSNPKHAFECLMQFGRDVFPTLWYCL